MPGLVNNRDLLYNTAHIQYLVITYNGKVSEKEYTYIYIYKLHHFAVHLKLSQHCKSTILQLKKNMLGLSTAPHPTVCFMRYANILNLSTAIDVRFLPFALTSKACLIFFNNLVRSSFLVSFLPPHKCLLFLTS